MLPKKYEIKYNSNKIQLVEAEDADCSMNHACIFKKSFVKFYRCKQCQIELGDLICEKCYFKCHRGHEQESVPVESLKSITENHCKCAENGHIITKVEEVSKTCCFEALALNLKINQFVELTDTNNGNSKMIVCYGCFIGCDYVLNGIEVKYITNDQFECNCINCRQEQRSGESNLIKLFMNFHQETRINLRKIFQHFMINNKLKSDYEKEIVSTLNKYKRGEVGINENFASCEQKLILFKIGIKLNKGDNFNLIQKVNLVNLCKEIKFFGMQRGRGGGDKKSDRNEDIAIFGYKFYYMFFIRNLLIKPCLQNKTCLAELNNLSNMTPFHRQLFREKYDTFDKRVKEYIKDLPSETSDNFNIFEVFSSLLNSATQNQSQANGNLHLFIIEYLKWCCILSSFDYSTSNVLTEKEKQVLNFKILRGVDSIAESIRKNKLEFDKNKHNPTKELQILKYLQKFYKTYLIRFNDECFFSYMKENKNIKLFFEKGEENNKDPLDTEPHLSSFKSLFFAKNRKVHVHPEMYELLLSYEDSYISGLQTLIRYPDGTIFEIIDKYFNEKSLIKLGIFKENSVDHPIYTDTINCINNYANTDLSPINFYEDIKMSLSRITEKMKSFDSLDNVSNRAIEQMRKIKEPYFSVLFTIYSMFNNDAFIKAELPGDKIEFILTTILDIFRLFFDNPFVISYFFTQGSFKSISNFYRKPNTLEKYHVLTIDQISFYKEAIENSIKLEYPLDLLEFSIILVQDKQNMSQTRGRVNRTIRCKNESESGPQEEMEPKSEAETESDLLYKISKVELFSKILQICTKESLMKINHLVINFLGSIKYIEVLRSNFFGIDDLQKELYLKILEVVNLLNDYHYYLLPESFPIDQIKIQLNKLSFRLSESNMTEYNKLISIGHLIIFTKTVNRYYAISHFKVYPCTLKNVIEDNNEWKLKKTLETRVTEEKSSNPQPKIINKSFMFSHAFGRKLSQVSQHICEEYETKVDLLISNLIKFKTHFDNIENHSDEMFKHFEEVILLPTIYLVYDILYFVPTISSNVKYLAYKLIILFMRCYKFFLETIRKYFLPSNFKQLQTSYKSSTSMIALLSYNIKKDPFKKIMKLITDTFVIVRKNEDLDIFFQNIHDCVENDIELIEKEPLKVQTYLTKFIKYVSGFKRAEFLSKIDLEESIFFDFHNKFGNLDQENDVLSKETIKFKTKIQSFIDEYLKKKQDTNNNFLIDYFKTLDKENEKENEVMQFILKDLLSKIFLEEGATCYNDRFFSCFDFLNKIFISNPSLFQGEILLSTTTKEIQPEPDAIPDEGIIMTKKENSIINYVISQLPLVYQLTFIDYHKLNSYPEPKYKSIDIFVSLIEFLRLLCENHNQKFQMLLASELIEKNRQLVHFFIQITPLTMNHFDQYTQRKDIAKYFKENSYEYFKPLISKVTDFQIELIQGSMAVHKLIQNLVDDTSEFNHCFLIYLNSSLKPFEAYEEGANLFYLSQFFKFIVCLLEEYSTEINSKKDIIDFLNPKKIISLFIFCTQQLFSIYSGFNTHKVEKLELKMEYSKYLLKGYIDHYDNFVSDYFFTVAYSSIKFLEIAFLMKSSSKIQELMQEIKTQTSVLTFDGQDKWRTESFNFFYSIMKNVEVLAKFDFITDTDDIEEAEVSLQNHFLIHPDVLLLSKKDFISFEENAPYENENTKLDYMVKYIPKLIKTIKFKKLTKNESNISKSLSKVSYIDTVKISSVLALVSAMLITMSSFYQERILNTPYALRVERNIDWIFYLGLIHLIFLFSVVCNWVYFEVFFKKNKPFNLVLFKGLVGKLFKNTALLIIFWSFFWGLVAICFPSCHFGYSLQLFSIFGLFDTMKTVIVSVKLRYKQFLSAGFLIIIFNFFFSSIKFLWFCDDVTEECQHYLYCFLALITNGIRAGNGVGFGMKSITEEGYYSDFIIEWSFYFSVILILLNVINGIIVDTFQEQREKNNEINEAKQNLCYICNSDRSYFEKTSQNYEEHINSTHCYINYFQYLLSLKQSVEQNLNSIDYSILQQVNTDQTTFFPQKKELGEE